DEPTTHLDINHQTEILSLVQQLNKEQGITVIAALHDLNLAAMYFDRLVILKDGSIFADGSPVDVLTEDIIGKVFNAPVHITNHPATGKPYVVLLPVQKN
ncbi:MAG: ABC transporter ATP-binding protein, partial [Chloroflexi bacterium]|nr:ABC transporter ATP-binding protein [Chloroflexota bacterium]